MAGGSVDKRGAARQEAIEWVQRLCAAVRQAVEGDRVIAWLYDAPRQAVSPLAVESPSGIDELPREWETIPLARMPAAVTALVQGRPVDDRRRPGRRAHPGRAGRRPRDELRALRAADRRRHGRDAVDRAGAA